MKVKTDTHIHTFLSNCCSDPEMNVDAIVKSSVDRGLELIAITDHLWANPAVPCNGFYDLHPLKNLEQQMKEIRGKDYPIPVLAGCEADMCAPGKFGITPEVRDMFDFVTLASDHFHMIYFMEQAESETPEAWAKQMVRFFRSAVTSGLCDVLVHPVYICGHMPIYDKAVAAVPDEEFLEIFGEAASRNVGLELNSAVLAGIGKQEYTAETADRIFRLAKKAGCKFVFGSDAHKMADFDIFHLAEETANRAGLTEDDLYDFTPILKRAEAKRGRAFC